ncbi:MAG: dGTP triphosphohydrolase [Bacteroidota bacterium]
MKWTNLLSNKRPGDTVVSGDLLRSRFEQDYDRIIFSHPFRKLQDKTQVFPLPEDDFVHTRLTHSLEVSSVGRSLGKNAGRFLLEKYPELERKGFTVHDFGAIVGAASLAHDLGNPPFGHSGEDSISSFYKTNEKGLYFQGKVTEEDWKDLTQFEGNAQGFRILNHTSGGLKLTYATLGAFTKYPISAHSDKVPHRKSQKKYGFYQGDLKLFESMATTMGLISLGKTSWCRHPLTFLVEAADDICYHIIDLEDGCRLGLIPFEEVKGLLAAILGDQFSDQKLGKISTLNEKLGVLRAMAISRLIQECTSIFEQNEEAMLTGEFDQALTDLIPAASALKEIIALSIEKIYRSKLVLEKEAGGFEVIDFLIESFATAMYKVHFSNALAKHKSTLRLLPEEYAVLLGPQRSVYESLQVINDFVSGLTDSHAVRLYQTIKGLRMPL